MPLLKTTLGLLPLLFTTAVSGLFAIREVSAFDGPPWWAWDWNAYPGTNQLGRRTAPPAVRSRVPDADSGAGFWLPSDSMRGQWDYREMPGDYGRSRAFSPGDGYGSPPPLGWRDHSGREPRPPWRYLRERPVLQPDPYDAGPSYGYPPTRGDTGSRRSRGPAYDWRHRGYGSATSMDQESGAYSNRMLPYRNREGDGRRSASGVENSAMPLPGLRSDSQGGGNRDADNGRGGGYGGYSEPPPRSGWPPVTPGSGRGVGADGPYPPLQNPAGSQGVLWR